jgi:hypothetical protein
MTSYQWWHPRWNPFRGRQSPGFRVRIKLYLNPGPDMH